MKKNISSIVVALFLVSCAKNVEEISPPTTEPTESNETVSENVRKVFIEELFRSIFGGSRK
jgi:PBP1b-binding outer membrane lipoprotein LpoB